MGATYTRQSTFTDGDIITAAHSNDEFNQLVNAFAASTGHTHDGTSAEGGPITKLLGTAITIGDGTAATDIAVTFDGETNDGVLTWKEDEDYFEFSDDILIASTEKLQFRDTAIYINSSTDGQLDIVADTEVQIAATTIDINGNTDVSGTLTYGSLSDGSITITAFVDEDDMSSNSATLVPTQQSVKAYVDAQITAEDLDFQADSGGALSIDLDSETLTFTGGTGIDTSGSGNAVTFAIDSTVATLTGSQSLTNKTIDVDNNTVSNIEVDNLKSGVLDTDLSSVSGSDDTLASAKAIKTYVDAQVTAQDLDFQGDSGGALSIDLDSETLDIAGGTGIDTTGSGNTLTVAIDSTVTTLTGSQTLTNKTLTSAVLNGTISGTSIKDEDNMSSDSASHLATQQSIKAYVDSQVATANELSELTDTNITSPADGALLFYDTGTSKWIDNVVSGDITIADTGVATIQSGAVDNDMLAGSIANAKLANSTVSFGGISLALGASDATPAFDLADATNYPTSSLSGTITNAQLAGSIADSKLNTISTAGKVDIGALEIDGATDIGADLADADLIIVDDGANGTERKSAMSRVPTYVFSKVSGDATVASDGALTIAATSVENSMLAGSIADTKLNTISTADKVSLSALDIDGGSDIGADLTTSDLIVVDDGAGGTNRKAALSRLTTYMTNQGFSTEDPTALAIALG